MTIRHMTGSAELITLLNRFGHCISYTTTLELEIAMCDQVTDRKEILPSNINKDKNVLTHFLFG